MLEIVETNKLASLEFLSPSGDRASLVSDWILDWYFSLGTVRTQVAT